MPLRSLRARLALFAGLSVAAVIALTSTFMYLNLDRALNHAIEDTLRIRLSEVRSEADADRVDLDDNRAYAQVLGRDGSVIATTFAAEGRVLLDDEARAVVLAEGIGRSSVVVNTTDGTRGKVAVLASLTDDGAAIALAGVDVENESLARRRVRISLLIAAPLLTAIAAGIAWLVVGAALRPAEQMADRADAISLNEPGRRLPKITSSTELGHLATTLNSMLDRLERTYAQERAFVDDASHELRTPIAILRGELELALGDVDDIPTTRAALTSAIEEVDRLGTLTNELLMLARADSDALALDLEAIDLEECVAETLERYGPTYIHAVALDAPAPVTVHADRLRTEQIVINLLANADRFAREQIRVSIGRDRDGPFLRVSDDGPGFPADLLPRALDRFTRADSARSRDAGGTGLGLAIVDALARAQGATVTLGNGGPLPGADVLVRFAAR